MALRTTDALVELLDRREKLALPPEEEWLAQVAEEIAQAFHVQPDEVAVLELSQPGKALRFVLPGKLRPVGSIPLTSPMALAARTARERRLEIDNSFAASRHVSVFEGMPLGRLRDESIHKIMSAPILLGTKVIGVVQISHKGPSPTKCGPDFTSIDLAQLSSLNGLLSRFLTICRTSALSFQEQESALQPI